MTDSFQALIKIQAQIVLYRRLAQSGHLAPGLARLLTDLANDVEAKARQIDAQAVD
jgi:hypothetical protein